MKCPACHKDNNPGQKFCGACGYQLERECLQCGATNPHAFAFCGQCGHNLAASGMITLVRSGLIAETDHHAAQLLGHLKEEMAGKPFSLFIAREDLAVFFSRWNELLGSEEKQTVELALKHKKGKKIYVSMECTLGSSPTSQVQLIHLSLNDVSDHRMALDQLQFQQDLLRLIYDLTDRVRSVWGRHLNSAITEALKKICLFSKADRCFIYGINRDLKRLEIIYQWIQPASPGGGSKPRYVPLEMVKRSIVRLRREHAYIISDVSVLPASERYELLTWHRADLGAVLCHIIYMRGQPIAIIGAARNQAGMEWDPDCVALIKLFGQMVSDVLPFSPGAKTAAEIESSSRAPGKAAEVKPLQAGKAKTVNLNVNEKTGRRPRATKMSEPTSVPTVAGPLPDPGKPMQLEKLTNGHTLEQQTVFSRDDGLILLTCPYCGIQESVSIGNYEKLGNAVQVQCSCHKRFATVLEKRRAYRKAVWLEGFFTIAGEFGPNDTKGSIWGPMVVKNLSKTGLRFFSKRIDLVHPGDYLMVRFNLDNSNQALIHKKAQVVSIRNNEVGCRFKGADAYDITLGFYFI